MHAGRRCGGLFGLFEEPGGGGADEGQERRPAEDVDVGHEGGLLLHEAVEEAQGAGAASGGAEAVGEVGGDEGRFLLEDRSGGGDVGADLGLVKGGAADQGGGGHGDADGAADVAKHVGEAGGVAHLPVGDGGHHHGGHGDKDKAEGEAGEGDGNQQGVGAGVEVDLAENEGADGEAEEAGAEQLAVVNAGAEEADDGRADEGADAAGEDDDAGGEGGVAEDFLIVEGQDGDGDVDAHSQHGNQDAAGAEVAVFEDMEVDEAFGMGPGMPDPTDEGEDERGDGPADPGGAEPVVLLALVEDDLEAAGPDAQKAEADVVEGADFGVPDVGWVVDEPGDEDDGEKADGDIDVEGIAPTECIGKPAAEGGTEHRGEHDAQAVGGHGHGTFGDGKAFEKDGLGEGLQGSAACSLEDAGEQDDAEGGGGSAKEGGDGEDGDADEEKALAAEAAGKPVGGGEDDGVGDQVGGEDPGGFRVGGRERAGDVGQGD